MAAPASALNATFEPFKVYWAGGADLRRHVPPLTQYARRLERRAACRAAHMPH
ncbi:hypothetical protein [Mesorhizobium sp. 113-3-3]|jgi:hypothetical protein|uniref:hypothetical protein n=1 Tax=Mesorhizobium sp. 113-3-3 TaxID=2744516 RepID=UPI0019254ECA|nr:hypothetical protein [Mesorhizobium sp. 113-3-3]